MKIKLKEQLKRTKGITLIALVITIIVLLILAGVTIATLTGDNGILTKAQNAKTQNDKATAKEKVDLAIAASLDETGKINLGQLKTNLNNIDGINPKVGDITDSRFPLKVTVDGVEVTIEKDSNGKYSTSVGESTGSSGGGQEEEQISDHSEVVVPTITATGNLANKPNIKEVRQGNIPIPQGYNYIKGDKIGGAVITDAASGKEKEGNEFVWVPVDTLSNMAVPTSGTDANTNYRGVLYNWDTDATGNTAYDWSADSTSYREPANLSSSYDSTSKNSSWTSTLYQEEYNKMVRSVSNYGGFYVGRYEMSINDTSKNAQSKYGETSATAEKTSANQWYGLYNKAKTYAPENADSKVVSSMIWGSQWDAMLRWMKNNDIDVTGLIPKDYNQTRITGGANKDKLNNVYDLLGNSIEFTQEAYTTTYRTLRGGHYLFNSVPSYRSNNCFPTDTFFVIGSRLTLYVK